MQHPELNAAQKQYLLTTAKEAKLERIDFSLVEAARPELCLQTGKLDDPILEEIGRSRLGGAPDLPSGTGWPAEDGDPLGFMAQLRLAELSIPDDWPLPKDGLLSIFKGSDDERFNVEHKIIYTPNPETLERLTPPPLPYDYEHLKAIPITSTELGINIPSYGEDELDQYLLSDDEMDQYFVLQDQISPGCGASLLGRDRDVDELPTERLAIDLLKGLPYDPNWKEENIDQIQEESKKWVPLFQMSSNFDIDLLMWDYYTFLVLIRLEDLFSGRFDRTHGHLARI